MLKEHTTQTPQQNNSNITQQKQTHTTPHKTIHKSNQTTHTPAHNTQNQTQQNQKHQKNHPKNKTTPILDKYTPSPMSPSHPYNHNNKTINPPHDNKEPKLTPKHAQTLLIIPRQQKNNKKQHKTTATTIEHKNTLAQK
jgi:hypothetical protein